MHAALGFVQCVLYCIVLSICLVPFIDKFEQTLGISYLLLVVSVPFVIDLYSL